jgi:hypothetical protein
VWICLLELGPVSVKEDEEAEAEGEDEEGVPGQEQEECLQHPQEHRHVDVALRQLRVHAHLCKINQINNNHNKSNRDLPSYQVSGNRGLLTGLWICIDLMRNRILIRHFF